MTQDEQQILKKLSVVNGQAYDHISIDDRGFAFGDGLFESMLYERGRVALLSLHLTRLMSDSSRLGFVLNRDILVAQLNELIQQAKDSAIAQAKIKIIVTRGVAGSGCYAEAESTPNVVISIHEMPVSPALQSAELISSPVNLPDIPVLAGIKHLNRLVYILGAQQLQREASQEVLFLDQQQYLIESMHHNVFMVQGKNLLTPELKRCGVKGVMRSLVMQRLANSIGFTVSEANFRIDDLIASDAVFLCNSVRGFTPITRVDGVELGGNEAWLQLQSALENYKENV